MTVEEIKAEITRVAREAKRGPRAHQDRHHARINELLTQLEHAELQAEPVNA